MSARRSAVNSVRKLRRSSFCTGVYAFFSRMVSRALRLLFFLAGDTGPGPRNRREPRLGDRLATVAADAVRALFHAPQRAFDRLQALGVGLFQFQLYVHLVVAGGLIADVALAAGIVLHRPLQRLGGTAPEQLAALAHQRYPKYFQIHAGVLLRGPSRQGQAEIVPRPSTGPRGRVAQGGATLHEVSRAACDEGRRDWRRRRRRRRPARWRRCRRRSGAARLPIRDRARSAPPTN